MKSFTRFLMLLAVFAGSGAAVSYVGAATTLSGLVTLPAGTLVMPGAITGGQALRVGEAVASTFDPRIAGFTRPVGSIVYGRDGAEAFIKTGQGSTQWEQIVTGSVQGGGSAAQIQARALSLLNATQNGFPVAPGTGLTCFREDWVYSLAAPPYVNSPIGSASNQNDQGNVIGGKLLINTGATANSRSRTSQFGTIVGRPDTNKFYYAVRMAAVTTFDAQSGLEVGLSDTTFATALSWGVCGGTSTTNWVFSRDGGLCAGTNVDSSSVANTAFAIFEIWGVADGKVHAARNTTEVSGSPFTMAASPTVSLAPFQQVTNGTTASSRSATIDWYQVCWMEG